MKTEKTWWLKLFCVLFMSLFISSLCLSWIVSTLQLHQQQQYQLQQSLSGPAFLSLEPLPIFWSYFMMVFGLVLIISVVIFLFLFKYLNSFIKAKSLLIKYFSSPLDHSTREEALKVFSHSSNPYLISLQDGLQSVLRENFATKKENVEHSAKEPLFSELVSRVCQKSSHFYPFLSIHAHMNTDIALPVFSSALFQALWELVKNTAEAMAFEQKSLQLAELHVRSFHYGHWFCCELEDNGPGMSKGEIDQACELYFSTKKSSTGLGLSVVQSVLSRIGGIMKLSPSQKLGGLKISLFIPLDYMEHIQSLKQMDQKQYSSEVSQL